MSKIIKIIAIIFVPIIAILVLGIIFVNTWSNKQTYNPNSQVNQALRDQAAGTQRKNSVGTIAGDAQDYRAKNGKYPTNETVNSSTFQSEYNLAAPFTQDPHGTTPVIGISPSKNTYSYSPTASDGSMCNNVDKTCLKFKVVAIMNNGSQYSLTESQ